MERTNSARPTRRFAFRLHNFDIVFLCSVGVYLALIWSTHLPLSMSILKGFVKNAIWLVGATYVLAFILTAIKCGWGFSRDRSIFRDPVAREYLLKPYFTLDFFFMTLRRTIALFGIIYLFLHLKHVILFINKANYDQLFWSLDRVLHGGVQPNIWAIELVGDNYTLQVIIDWLYIKYFDYKLLVSLFFLLDIPSRKLSNAFFTAYALLWALGGLSYLVMPADGPCYALLSPYSVGMNNKARSHLFPSPMRQDIPKGYIKNFVEAKTPTAKFYQQRLWEDRQDFLSGKRYPTVFYGIAAMPSLHVAAVSMIAVFLWQLSMLMGIVGVVFASITLFGSVFLQWHYAIDGYIGLLLGIACSFIALKTPALIGRRTSDRYISFGETLAKIRERSTQSGGSS